MAIRLSTLNFFKPSKLVQEQFFEINKLPGSLFPKEWQFSQFSYPIGRLLIQSPYGLRLLAWCCRRSWFHALFHTDVTLIQQFLTETGATTLNPTTVVSYSLTQHIWFAWSLTAIEQNPEKEFDQRVNITGLSQLQERYQHGPGIILVSYHSVFAKLIPLCLKHCGFENSVTIGLTRSILKTKGETATKSARTIEHACQLMATRKVLKAGGIAFMLPDGFYGNYGIWRKFYKRQREFKTGFAELAISDNAVVIPVVPSLAEDGRFKLTILEPFDTNTALSKKEQVNHLVEQYISFLAKCWQNPWNIYMIHFAKHLAFPTMGDEPRTGWTGSASRLDRD